MDMELRSTALCKGTTLRRHKTRLATCLGLGSTSAWFKIWAPALALALPPHLSSFYNNNNNAADAVADDCDY